MWSPLGDCYKVLPILIKSCAISYFQGRGSSKEINLFLHSIFQMGGCCSAPCAVRFLFLWEFWNIIWTAYINNTFPCSPQNVLNKCWDLLLEHELKKNEILLLLSGKGVIFSVAAAQGSISGILTDCNKGHNTCCLQIPYVLNGSFKCPVLSIRITAREERVC